jgi:hypothetical protein
VVEAARAPVAGSQRDLAHRQPRLLEQRAREVQPLRAQGRDRCRAQVLHEEPTQMTLAHAQLAADGWDPTEVLLRKELQRAGDGGRASRGGRQEHGGIGAAAEAGPVSRLLGGGGAGEEAHVLFPRHLRGAAGPAVDPGRGDGGDEGALEAAVAALHRAVQIVAGVVHRRDLVAARKIACSPFSDIEVKCPGQCARPRQRRTCAPWRLAGG